MSDHDAPIVVVIPGDLHFQGSRGENVDVARWMVDEVNGIIHPDFVQFIGDNVQHATDDQFGLFDEVRGLLGSPSFALVGDHDIKGDPGASRFRRHVGEPFGAMTLRGFRFLRLNTQEAKPVGLSADQVAWFRGEVDRALGRGEKVVIFQHNYPYQIWEDFAGPGIDEWRETVQTRRIGAIVCGHTHYGQVANDGRNVSIAVRSIGDPEGGPPGYTVLYLRGDDLAVAFRSKDERGPFVAIVHPRDRILATGPEHVIRGTDRVVARCWPNPGVALVRYRIDGDDRGELVPLGDGHWAGPLPGGDLAKGEHILEVLAEDDEGRIGGQVIRFMVDPTGRYTAVPGVRPPVDETAFC